VSVMRQMRAALVTNESLETHPATPARCSVGWANAAEASKFGTPQVPPLPTLPPDD
jgi:hypothetical protein